jgi:D-3-phosphoglycerate dehydrogenase
MPEKPVVLLTNAMHPDGEAILAPRRLITAPDARPKPCANGRRRPTASSCARNCPTTSSITPRASRPWYVTASASISFRWLPPPPGIAVANLPGSNTNAVAEYVMSALMHLRRRCCGLTQLRGEGWSAARASADSLSELSATTLGILGVGTIGRRVAAIARDGFGMKVLGTSRRKGSLPSGIEEVSLDDLFARSDAIAVCCALTDETRGMVNRDLLGRMPPHAVLVNVSTRRRDRYAGHY